MEIKTLNVLMVDDHPVILEGYIAIFKLLSQRFQKYHFNIECVGNFSQAVDILDTVYGFHALDLALLDIGLNHKGDALNQSGEDLGILIRKKLPNAKIMIMTGFENYTLIRNLLDSINPEGIMVKGDINTLSLTDAIIDVMEDPPYYSKTIAKMLARKKTHSYTVDHTDKLILYYISRGKSTNELPKFLHLSLSAIEKRKKRLKEVFKVTDGNDIDLINKAKEEGYL